MLGEILMGIQNFLLKKINLKFASAKWLPFCLGLNVLRNHPYKNHNFDKMMNSENLVVPKPDLGFRKQNIHI